jgi:hypothetical protein
MDFLMAASILFSQRIVLTLMQVDVKTTNQSKRAASARPPIYCSIRPSVVVNVTKHCLFHSHEVDDLIDYSSCQPHRI